MIVSIVTIQELEMRNAKTIGKKLILPVIVLGGLGAAACTPTVKVEVPDKPIEINLNINMKIEQNVRVRMENELEKAAQTNPGIF